MPKTVTSTEAQNNFGAILQWTDENRDEVVVERRGTPAAVIIPYTEYAEIVRLRREEEKRQALTRIRALRARVQSSSAVSDAAEGYRAAGFAESVVQETLEMDRQLADTDD